MQRFKNILYVMEPAELHVVHVWEAIGESAMRHGAFMSQPEDEVNAYVEQVRRIMPGAWMN